jgi:hypothetical protein
MRMTFDGLVLKLFPHLTAVVLGHLIYMIFLQPTQMLFVQIGMKKCHLYDLNMGQSYPTLINDMVTVQMKIVNYICINSYFYD